MRQLSIFALISLILLAVSSCEDSCPDNKNTLPLASFFVAGDPEQQVRVDSLEIIGIGVPNDSVWSPATEQKSEIYLPFRIDSDTTGYSFSLHTEAIDLSSNVRFIYTRTPRFTDAECGVSYIFDIIKIECTGNLIDSVTCPRGFIDNTNYQDLKIYLNNSLER